MCNNTDDLKKEGTKKGGRNNGAEIIEAEDPQKKEKSYEIALHNAPEALDTCNNAQGINYKVGAEEGIMLDLHNVQDMLGNMAGKDACNNAPDNKDHVTANVGSNALNDNRGGVIKDGVMMLDSGELDKKEQSDALALHTPADAGLTTVGKDVCNNTQGINKKIGA